MMESQKFKKILKNKSLFPKIRLLHRCNIHHIRNTDNILHLLPPIYRKLDNTCLHSLEIKNKSKVILFTKIIYFKFFLYLSYQQYIVGNTI